MGATQTHKWQRHTNNRQQANIGANIYGHFHKNFDAKANYQ